MSEFYSKSLDLLTEKTRAQLKTTDLAYLGDVDESDPDDFNRKVTLAILGQFLLGNCKIYPFTIASGSEAATDVSFGETLDPAPDWFVVLGSYQGNADARKILVTEVNASLIATKCQVQASGDAHTGITGAVLVHQPTS